MAAVRLLTTTGTAQAPQYVAIPWPPPGLDSTVYVIGPPPPLNAPGRTKTVAETAFDTVDTRIVGVYGTVQVVVLLLLAPVSYTHLTLPTILRV